MTTLLLKANDIPTLTAMSGNIDADSLKPHIYTAQSVNLKRILGETLYNKILTDYETDALAGEYLIIYNNYIVDLLTYISCGYYMTFGGYKTANQGIYKTTAEGGQLVDYKEVTYLITQYKELAANIESNFYKYIKTISIPEYTNDTNDYNTNKVIPWY